MIGVEPLHIRMTFEKTRRRARDDGAVDFPYCQQFGQRFIGDAGQLDPVGQIDFNLFHTSRRIRACLIPVHVRQFHAAFVVHPAPHVHGGVNAPTGEPMRLPLRSSTVLMPAFLFT